MLDALRVGDACRRRDRRLDAGEQRTASSCPAVAGPRAEHFGCRSSASGPMTASRRRSCERQRAPPVVLQQHHRPRGDLARRRAVVWRARAPSARALRRRYGRSKRPARNLMRSTRRTASSTAAGGRRPALTSSAPCVDVGAADHLHVHARGRAPAAPASASSAAKPVVDHLRHGGVVADDEAVELPFAAQDLRERERIGGGGHAVEVVERAHERCRRPRPRAALKGGK